MHAFLSWHCQCIGLHLHGTQCIWLHFLCHHFIYWWRSTTQHHPSEAHWLSLLLVTPSSLGITKSHLIWFFGDLTCDEYDALCLQHPIWVHWLLLPPAGSSTSSYIYRFCKRVKSSVSDYNVFKEDHLWNYWHHHLLTTAWSHKVDNFLRLTFPICLLLLMTSHFFKNRNVLSSLSSNKRSLPPTALLS